MVKESQSPNDAAALQRAEATLDESVGPELLQEVLMGQEVLIRCFRNQQNRDKTGKLKWILTVNRLLHDLVRTS